METYKVEALRAKIAELERQLELAEQANQKLRTQSDLVSEALMRFDKLKRQVEELKQINQELGAVMQHQHMVMNEQATELNRLRNELKELRLSRK